MSIQKNQQELIDVINAIRVLGETAKERRRTRNRVFVVLLCLFNWYWFWTVVPLSWDAVQVFLHLRIWGL